MGKGKHRNKKVEVGCTSKDDLDFQTNPMFAAARARTEPMPESWAKGAIVGNQKKPKDATKTALNTIVSSRCDRPTGNNEMCEDKGATSGHRSEEESEEETEEETIEANESITLGEEDSVSPQSVRCNVPEKTEQIQGRQESPESNQGERKRTYASLLIGNNQRKEGSSIPKVKVGDGPVRILTEDAQDAAKRWEHTLVGYFGGRFPGKKALDLIGNAWKVEVSVHHHSSGWIIFEFNVEESKIEVLQGGPYMVFGRPLLLKIMPIEFTFEDEELSCFPVWVRLPNLPLFMWGILSLAKICAKIGNAVSVDKYTVHSERNIIYENLPKFCTNCKTMGHSDSTCKVLQALKPKQAIEIQQENNPDMAVEREVGAEKGNQQPSSQNTDPRAEKNVQTEWVTKIRKANRGQAEGKNSKEWNQNGAEQQASRAGEDSTEKHKAQEGDQCGQHIEPAPEKQAKPNQSIDNQEKVQKRGDKSGQMGNKKTHIIGLATAKENATPGVRKIVPPGSRNIDQPQSSNAASLNKPLKQNGILNHVRKNKVDIMGILETKIKKDRMKNVVCKKFRCWATVDNLQQSPNGRIMLIWKEDRVDVEIIESTAQVIHCLVTCKTTSAKLYVSFVYAFNKLVGRRTLWENLRKFNTCADLPWLLLGDFNNVLIGEEKINGVPVTNYEIKDFQDCCYDLGLSDLKHTGLSFTWTNNFVWSKLDRAMVNPRWIQEGWIATTNFGLPGKWSDHSPCVVSMVDNKEQGCRPFKFFNMWTLHADFPELIRDKWRVQVTGTAMYRLCKKLKMLKDPLKKLNRLNFSHISARAETADQDLLLHQQMLHDNPRDEELQGRVSDLRQKANKLAEVEWSFCSQVAKVKYLNNCDRGTKFFHDLIKHNRARNQIVFLSDSNGAVTTSTHQVNSMFVDYYMNLLGTKKACQKLDVGSVAGGRMVSNEQSANLTRAVTDKEIKEALFSIGEDKAPGPDGYSSCFFKKSWDMIGTDVCAAIKEFFSAGTILKQMNHTIIALVPKTRNATKVEEFRPISCCNVTYKIIAKILASRLSPILEKLVNHAQSAFVPNRSMTENIYMVQEIMQKYSWKRISPRCILKVDIRKAYDTVNWEFLEDALLGFKFPAQFVKWVMQCVSTTSYSILINGSLHGFFKGNQGLRQGDPLSPFLFTICLEVLSRSMEKLCRNPEFNHHPKCSELAISHLAFADDLILFSRGDAASVSLVMECLQMFGCCSGLNINASKSQVYMAGICQEEMEKIKVITGFSIGQYPFRYLGIPVAAARLTIDQFNPLFLKISEYINAWAGSTLSYAGRSELIKSVLQGVECFWLSILPIPTGVRGKIIALCRNFLWGGKVTVDKKPLVAWAEMCKPRQEGGLGFIDLKAWNMALMSKSLWNLQSKKDSLWVKWVHHVYTKESPFWDYTPSKEDSQTVKFLVTIRYKIVTEEGTKLAALDRLQSWVEQESFNVKKAYDFFRSNGAKPCWTKVVWHRSIMPKHSFIFWLCMKEKLLTRDKLIAYIHDTSCGLCGFSCESQNHLYFQCPIVRQIWSEIKVWLGFTRELNTLKAAVKWTIKKARGTGVQAIAKRIGIACSIYSIWKHRNARIFERKITHPSGIIRDIKMQIGDDAARFAGVILEAVYIVALLVVLADCWVEVGPELDGGWVCARIGMLQLLEDCFSLLRLWLALSEDWFAAAVDGLCWIGSVWVDGEDGLLWVMLLFCFAGIAASCCLRS
ncbi:hypothetical protein Acr_12g0000840 [Actinidia rufa]|uniref:Reverse transcriptase domain-containing protein n=1 Tax=Actinidia rufa TaxID=165716 RepID=A0A7J0FG26_9ERIC|nr:hypothetical protein Acr_12g0000840 [Actinidia rufa]